MLFSDGRRVFQGNQSFELSNFVLRAAFLTGDGLLIACFEDLLEDLWDCCIVTGLNQPSLLEVNEIRFDRRLLPEGFRICHAHGNFILLAADNILLLLELTSEGGELRQRVRHQFPETQIITKAELCDGQICYVACSGGHIYRFNVQETSLRRTHSIKLAHSSLKQFLCYEESHLITILTQHDRIIQFSLVTGEALPHYIDLGPFRNPDLLHDFKVIASESSSFLVGQLGASCISFWHWSRPYAPVECVTFPGKELVDLCKLPDETLSIIIN